MSCRRVGVKTTGLEVYVRPPARTQAGMQPTTESASLPGGSSPTRSSSAPEVARILVEWGVAQRQTPSGSVLSARI
eukprot:10989088-Alexandrium_andersonii.AAC.1